MPHLGFSLQAEMTFEKFIEEIVGKLNYLIIDKDITPA
jgi:hypothetical protein